MSSLKEKVGPLLKDKINSEHKQLIEKLEKVTGKEVPVCFFYEWFLQAFLKKFSIDDLIKYVANQKNPKYKLYFRRTIVGNKPKPEVFWTDEFGQLGLWSEIRGPQRLYTNILVATQDMLDQHKPSSFEKKFVDEKYGDPSIDGEIRISPKPFDVNQCLLKIKSNAELNSEEFVEFKNSPNYVSKEEVLAKIEAYNQQRDKEVLAKIEARQQQIDNGREL